MLEHVQINLTKCLICGNLYVHGVAHFCEIDILCGVIAAVALQQIVTVVAYLFHSIREKGG